MNDDQPHRRTKQKDSGGGVGIVDDIKIGSIVTLFGHSKLYALHDLELISPSLEELVEERDRLKVKNAALQDEVTNLEIALASGQENPD